MLAWLFFLRLASKSSSPLSYILCKLGMDPAFQLILHSSVRRDTCRLGFAMLTTVGDEEHGGKCLQQELWDYLQKSHLGMQALPSLCCGDWSGKKVGGGGGRRAEKYIHFLFKHEQGRPSFLSSGNPSQCVYSVSNGKHASTEEGFCTVYLHLEMAVGRYNKEGVGGKQSWWKTHAV